MNLVFGKDDALFGAIERQQGNKPFGKFLDAGTGLHSLRWIATLEAKGMTDFTAVSSVDISVLCVYIENGFVLTIVFQNRLPPMPP
jgi:hypothetical protein